MKMMKHFAVIVLLIVVGALYGRYMDPEDVYVYIPIIVVLVFFNLNMMLRRSLSFKGYFTSKYNLFTTKSRFEKEFDIPKALLFEKMMEVLEQSNFKLVDSDPEKFELLATTLVTFRSWGENLYISCHSEGGKTVLKCCSTCMFQMYDWGKNEENCQRLFHEVEESFII